MRACPTRPKSSTATHTRAPTELVRSNRKSLASLITSDDRTDALPLERKVKMHEAREAIINRLAPTALSEIDLNRFLQAVVSELGRMMGADRCDVIQLDAGGELR